MPLRLGASFPAGRSPLNTAVGCLPLRPPRLSGARLTEAPYDHARSCQALYLAPPILPHRFPLGFPRTVWGSALVAVAAITAGVGAASSIGSAVIGGNAASSAASAQENAAAQSNALLSQEYQQTRSDLAPYRDAGSTDFSAYNGLLNPANVGQTNDTLDSLPGYQFTRTQGLKAAQNAAAARGLGISGAALKGATTYATGLANSQYGTYANQLLSGAQLGENASAQTGSLGQQSASAQASNLTGAGNAAAAGDIGTANAISSGLTGAGNGLSNYYLYNALNSSNSGSLYSGYANDGTAAGASVNGLF